MKVWMLMNMYVPTPACLKALRKGHLYQVPDELGRLLVQAEAAAEYLKIGGVLS